MVRYFIGVYIIKFNRAFHGRLEIQNFSSCVEKIFHLFTALTCEIFFNTEEKFRISALPCACNILYFLNWEIRSNLKFRVLHLEKETHVGRQISPWGLPVLNKNFFLSSKFGDI